MKEDETNSMSYLDSTLKKLSILSGNKCAFPDCSVPLIDESGTLTGEICHIKARNSGGKRYDASQTNKERDDYENLILMCPIHHTVIDSSETIFTVEVLQQVKKNHESKNHESNEQGKLEILIEKLHSIIEKDNVHSPNSSELLKEQNTSLIRAKKLAADKIHEERRQKWLYSHDGLIDTINSINEIYSLINQQISDNNETFSTLGIEVYAEKKFSRNIYNNDYGCQLEVEGFRENSYDNKPANIKLRIWLFKKIPSPLRRDLFSSEPITHLYFQPDLLVDGQVSWKETEKTSMNLTAKEICEKMFDLLISEISKKKSQRNSWKDDYIQENEGYW